MNEHPIPYGRQSISDQDIQAVVDVLRSDWLTQGPLAARFEAAVAAYCGARWAVAVNSGTSALHLACRALALAPGDRLWLGPKITGLFTLKDVPPDQDLALLRIRAPRDRLRPIAVGTSRTLQVGQRVLAIGNPFGLDFTLTTGIVSALGRSIPSLTGRKINDVIQTDAAINPGNSGGPLLDSAGRLVGVNTQIASPSGASAGIGFAVPVDTVNRVVPQLVRHGRVVRPQIGVVSAGDWALRRAGLGGVLVVQVVAGSPAETAGLRPTGRGEDGSLVLGDVIQRLGESRIASVDDLYAALERHKAGERVGLAVLRNGKVLETTIALEEGR